MPIDNIQQITTGFRNASRQLAKNEKINKGSERFRNFLSDFLEDKKNERIRKEEAAQRERERAEQQANLDRQFELQEKKFEAERGDVDKAERFAADDKLDTMRQSQETQSLLKPKMEEYEKAYDAFSQEPSLGAYGQLRKLEASISALDPNAIPNPVSDDKIFQEYLKPKEGPSPAELRKQMEDIQAQRQALDVNTAISEMSTRFSGGGWEAVSQYVLHLMETKPNVISDPNFIKAKNELEDNKPDMNQLTMQAKTIKAYAAQNWALMQPDSLDEILRDNDVKKKDYIKNPDLQAEINAQLNERREAYLQGVEAATTDMFLGDDHGSIMSLEDKFKKNAAIIQELKEEIYGRKPGVPFR